MKRNIKGFYTLEAAIFLPFVILAVISLGYFIKIEGMWENCIHGAIDESSIVAVKAGVDEREAVMTGIRVKQRIKEDNPGLDSIEIKNLKVLYSDTYEDKLISYRIRAGEKISFPLGFQWEFNLESSVRLRCFAGKKNRGEPLGAEGLEKREEGDAVYIFPHRGEKYHASDCTYVLASVKAEILTAGLKRKHKACSLCRSEQLPAGSLVFCFEGRNTAYHKGSCKTIARRTVIIDRKEAEKKGYSQCSKCGG